MEFVGKVENEYGFVLTREELEYITISAGLQNYSSVKNAWKEDRHGIFKNFICGGEGHDLRLFDSLVDIIDKT